MGPGAIETLKRKAADRVHEITKQLVKLRESREDTQKNGLDIRSCQQMLRETSKGKVTSDTRLHSLINREYVKYFPNAN